MSHFSTFQLGPDRVCEALSLLRMALPGLDELRWAAHCEDLASAGGGVLAAATAEGLFHGLALYRPQSDLRRDNVVRIEMLVAYELSPSGPIRASLLAALEDVRRDMGAHGFVLVAPGAGPRTIGPRKGESLGRAGFRLEAALLWKGAEGTRDSSMRRHAHLA